MGMWNDGDIRAKMKTAEQISYDELIDAGKASLAENEFWCIGHPDGLLPETRSKDLTEPVRTICDALNMDWDELTDRGYRLTRCKLKQ